MIPGYILSVQVIIHTCLVLLETENLTIIFAIVVCIFFSAISKFVFSFFSLNFETLLILLKSNIFFEALTKVINIIHIKLLDNIFYLFIFKIGIIIFTYIKKTLKFINNLV